MVRRSYRRWFRFSLRAFLVVITLLAIILAITVKRYRDRRTAIATIDRLGGGYSITIEGPEWMRRFINDDKWFYNLGRVSLGPICDGYDPSRPFDDDALGDIVPHLNNISHFNTLHISSAPISDAGLSHLKKLKTLRKIMLDGTLVTDAGLETLSEIKSLERVTLGNTAVTDKGVTMLRAKLPKCDVSWDGP